MTPKIVDLFCGGGGFTLGARLAGCDVVLSVDNDPDLTRNHRINFPGASLRIADIATIRPSDCTPSQSDGRGPFGVVGGPPCQGFSVIGKRNPLDVRNTLVTRFFELVGALHPDFFVFENVPGILRDPGKTLLEDAIARLPGIYTVSQPTEVDASSFGAPTLRRRVLVVGVAGRAPVDSVLIGEMLPSIVRSAIGDLASPQMADRRGMGTYRDIEDLSEYARRMRTPPPPGLSTGEVRTAFARRRLTGCGPTAHSTQVEARFRATKPGARERVSKFPRLEWDAPAPTLRAGTGPSKGSFQAARPLHPEEHRVITVREAARIQGFPDWYQFHVTKWHSFRMIGNSVSPVLAEEVMRRVVNLV